jgi:cell wall-associated NlpC family hydrolase
MTGIAPWAKEYIGIPFVSGGRDKTGADCYGLVRLVLTERFAVNLPLLSGDYTDADNFVETEALIRSQQPLLAGRRVEVPETGDVCVLKFHGLPTHLGVYAGGGWMLHTLRGTGSVLQRISDPHLTGRFGGWYRVN